MAAAAMLLLALLRRRQARGLPLTAAGELLAIVPGMDGAVATGQQVRLSLSSRGVALVE